MLSWYKSWFCKSGTLDRKGYVRHIVAALAFFFGFAFLGLGLFSLLLWTMIALHLPTWVAWLPILFWLTIGNLAMGSFIGIFVTSSLRFVRHLIRTQA